MSLLGIRGVNLSLVYKIKSFSDKSFHIWLEIGGSKKLEPEPPISNVWPLSHIEMPLMIRQNCDQYILLLVISNLHLFTYH